MKSKKLLLFLFPLLVFLFQPGGFVFAINGGPCYQMSSFGNANANGLYTDNGTQLNGGQEDFKNTTGAGWFLTTFDAGGGTTYFEVRSVLVNDTFGEYYYGPDSGYSTDHGVGQTWSNQAGFGGTAPAGSVATTTCPGGGGGGTGSSTPADLIIYNADIYPFIFACAALLFFIAFWVTLKA